MEFKKRFKHLAERFKTLFKLHFLSRAVIISNPSSTPNQNKNFIYFE